MDDIRNIIITEIFDIVLSAIILKIYFKTFFTEKEVKYIRVYIPTIMYIGWQILLMRGIELPVYCKMLISTILITIICLSAFIGSFALKLVFFPSYLCHMDNDGIYCWVFCWLNKC